jgi:hypothetical protein
MTHMMFMDDLIVYEESRAELVGTLSVVAEVSEALGMTLGLRKCVTVQVVAGKVVLGGRSIVWGDLSVSGHVTAAGCESRSHKE